MKNSILTITLFLSSLCSFAANFYVAPNGNDANVGDINNPVETIKRAQELASSGDTVYIRGGLYTMRVDQIAQYYSIWVYVTKLDKSGISYLAYPNETPIFDYKNIKPADYRITAFYINGSNIRIKGIEITGVQVTITAHTQSECFEIQGSNNTLEQIKMHDGMAIGVYILKGSNNLILNCDAYRNWDSVSEGGVGGNTDGFGCHAPMGNKNNIFRGCRAWYNSDDGFDLISSGEPVLIDNCWAFYNGYSVNTTTNVVTSRGDGNGFKAGGYGSTTLDKIPNPVPRNTIQFCMAVANKQSGFYSNHHLNGSNWYNNTAYRNNRNYNMLNRKAATAADYLTDVPGWSHVMANNLGYAAKYAELTDIDKASCTLNNNYFDLSFAINSSDFLSVDESLLTAPRQEDGSLPVNNLLRLKSTTKLIDAGTDIGFSFKGLAPDLGCFEYDSTLGFQKLNLNQGIYNYPNPFSTETKVIFNLTTTSKIGMTLYNLAGMKVLDIPQKTYSEGENTITLKRDGLSSGNYILVIQGHDFEQTSKKIMVQ
ncbi:right-handed parallel beta-helix repeat-containing protein [Flavobacterium cellulosilyticum]|uniref:right-handed parallel beta-helix repeat-containing protein n=1 Tax=Flavobacterium cellulosilyticum TaxID=2541731 RepID=UPI001404D20F|nr:right-handed parallel beta-helix repeat-containing protein [Flavobacterium cellulosilyticum]